MLNNKIQVSEVTLRQTINEAKKLYRDVKIELALSLYAQIVGKIIIYTKDAERKNTAIRKLQLLKLINTAFEPDYIWESLMARVSFLYSKN